MSRLAFFSIITLMISCSHQKSAHRTTFDEANKATESAIATLTEPEMVLIPAGSFLMGSGNSADNPIHRVYLDEYYIGKHEVTNAQFRQFCAEEAYQYPDAEWSPEGERSASDLIEKPSRPVVGINWEDAAAYCRWLSRKTGKDYRLPTEAEWEKAAHGGIEGRKYPWGDEEYDFNGSYRANCGSDSDNDRIRSRDGFTYAAPVGSFPPNPYGLYDMAGNVWEWCADIYEENYYYYSPDRNPQGPDSGEKRVLRGGSWYGGPQHLQCAARLWNYPKIRYASTGFRVAVTN